MMGRNHALSGAVGWLAVGPTVLAATAGASLTGTQLAIGTMATAGAALACDIDHRDAHIGRKFGPAGRVVAGTVQATVGHRTLTHSLVAIVVATVGTAAIAWSDSTVASAVLVGLLVYIAAVLIGPSLMVKVSTPVALVVGAVAGWAVYSADVAPGSWLVLAVGMGVALHIVGDGITRQGVPLFAPFSSRRFGVPLLTTGGPLEAIISLALSVALVVLAWGAFQEHTSVSALLPWR